MRPRTETTAPVPDRAGLMHTRLVKHPTRSNPLCTICRRHRTAYKCADCNVAICQWYTGRDCHLVHMLHKIEGQDWLEARARVGEVDEYHETEVF